MIKFIFFITICFAANPVDQWIDQNSEILKHDIKSVSFQLNVGTLIYPTKYDSIISGKIIAGKNKQFRFEMGPRTVVSDGMVWKSYDKRTDQIFIQGPDKQLEKSLFSWVKLKKMKALPVKLEPNGGYRITLLGGDNDIRAYFNPDSNELESIVIINSDIKTEIFQIILAIEETLNLEIGSERSESFDLR
jgi:outer membrane lipoprotein-sorting protein